MDFVDEMHSLLVAGELSIAVLQILQIELDCAVDGFPTLNPHTQC